MGRGGMLDIFRGRLDMHYLRSTHCDESCKNTETKGADKRDDDLDVGLETVR